MKEVLKMLHSQLWWGRMVSGSLCATCELMFFVSPKILYNDMWYLIVSSSDHICIWADKQRKDLHNAWYHRECGGWYFWLHQWGTANKLLIDYAFVSISSFITACISLQHSDRTFLLKFSALEIYNEVVNDLLNPESGPLRLLDDPEVSNLWFYAGYMRLLYRKDNLCEAYVPHHEIIAVDLCDSIWRVLTIWRR